MEGFSAVLSELYGGAPEPVEGSQGHYTRHSTRDGFREVVKTVMGTLALVPSDSYDTIYVTGQSGIVPGSIAAWMLKKSLAILRKGGERSHGNSLERDTSISEPRVIIIDDFLCTGNTMARLLRRWPVAKVVAVVLYGQPIGTWEIRYGYLQPVGLLRRKVLLKRVEKTHLFHIGHQMPATQEVVA
jgi:hypothetical protein